MPEPVSVVVHRTCYLFLQNMQNSVHIAGKNAKSCTVLHMQAPYMFKLHYDWTHKLETAVTSSISLLYMAFAVPSFYRKLIRKTQSQPR